MKQTCRDFLANTTFAVGSIVVLPHPARANGHSGNVFAIKNGRTSVRPVVVMHEW